MYFHIMTLFPEMVLGGLNESITGKAIEKGLIGVDAVNIRDIAGNRYGHVDDYTYGGGAGMLMQPEPVYLRRLQYVRKRKEHRHRRKKYVCFI